MHRVSPMGTRAWTGIGRIVRIELLNHVRAHATSGAKAVLFISHSDIVELYTPYQGQFSDFLCVHLSIFECSVSETVPAYPIEWSPID